MWHKQLHPMALITALCTCPPYPVVGHDGNLEGTIPATAHPPRPHHALGIAVNTALYSL